MRDITHRRQRLNELRHQLDAAWLAPVHDEDRIGKINAELRLLIGDDEFNGGHRGGGSSKSALRDMIAQAMANTAGAVPVRKVVQGASGAPPVVPRPAMGSRSSNPDRPPSAYQVALAICAAAKEMGADPIAVATGVTTRGGRSADHSVSRARAYAAFAIKKVHPHNAATAIGRWVAAPNPQNFVTMIEWQRRNGTLRWWDERLFQRVVMRLQTAGREGK